MTDAATHARLEVGGGRQAWHHLVEGGRLPLLVTHRAHTPQHAEQGKERADV